MRSRVLFALCVALGCAPSFALADWSEFVPTPIENHLFLDVYSSFERDHLRNDTRSSRWSDIFVREELSLNSIGYSYHPRFLLYQASLGVPVKQEEYEASFLEPFGWRYGSGLEYNVRMSFLPEHPYNLHLFTSRYEPVSKEQSATRHDSVQTAYGASFRFRRKPYFLNTGYLFQTIESGDSSSDIQKFNLDGQYFKRFESGNELSFTGAFNPSWFRGSSGLDGSSTEYLLNNLVNLKQVRLESSLTENTSAQESPSSGKFESNQFVWHERLTAYLPWHFRTDFSYRYQNNEGQIDDAGDAPTRKLVSKGDDVRLDIIHRLYQSLDTTYAFLRGTRTSSGGETAVLSNALGLNYTKSIPWGRALVGANLARGDTESRGQGTDVLNEPHSAISVPTGTFVLNQQNVEEESIVVFLRSPVEPFEAVALVEDEHYAVRAIPDLGTFEIQVYGLPPEFAVPGTYDFLVSYSLSAGDFDLRTDTFGGNASLELFGSLLTPYLSLVAVRSDVLSGAFPGIPVDATTYTAGLRVRRGPLRALGEYQRLEWEVSPYRAWKAEVQYVGSPLPTTSVYATASYRNKHYLLGESAAYASPFTEETESVSGSIQQQLIPRSLSLSVGGSYSRRQGLVDSNWYTGNASLSLKLGRMDLSAGASAYWYDTTGTTTVSTERDHQFFHVRLRRELF